MMNADAVLPNIDLNLEDQQYMHYFSPNQNHYMQTNRHDPVGMAQLVDSANQAVHYMPSKTTAIKPHMTTTSRSSMNTMNQAYSHGMSPLASMSSHNQMLNSPPMVDQIGPNSAANRYCKMPPQSVPISNHYETPPMARYPQQGIPNHHSPSSTENLNHYNQKYCTDSNESVNISTTLTHISETDNSHPHNNYAPTPPQSQQPMKLSPVNNNNNNMISTSRTFSQMNCNPTNNNNNTWSTIPPNMSNLNSQLKCVKTNNNSPNHSAFSTRNESQFSYLDQPNTDYLSITSTPVSSQTQSEHYMMRPNKSVLNQSSINKSKSDTFSVSHSEPPKPKPAADNGIHMIPNFVKKDCITAEKRNIIILKVVEQIIDPSTKSVLKETIVKNEEVITSCGEVQFNLLSSNDTTTASSNITRSPVGSSGMLGDISAFSNTKSVNNLSTTNSINLQASQTNNKDDCTFDSSINNNTNENKIKSNEGSANEEKFIGSQGSIDDESDEEERRQTASALLSLQSVSNTNTPVKEMDKEEHQLKLLPSAAEITSGVAIATALNSNTNSPQPPPSNESSSSQANETAPIIIGRLKPGVKVMAKWKDKNFYPAEVQKQLESHKWLVKFEDSANRNLFETEIIRIEYLMPNQEVMLTISGDLCIRAVIKKVWIKNAKNIDIDLEYVEEEKQFEKRHKLRDVFLNVEQGSAIQARSNKPNPGGAVFADVDLDNIVVGKRSRKQGNDSEAGSKKKLPENSSLDSESTTNGKKKRKHAENDSKKGNDRYNTSAKISVDCSSKKIDFHAMGHYHESSLAVSPRTSKPTLVMPTNELEKILGPLPKSSSKLFERIGFMLTSGDRNRNNPSEHESSAERSIPFDKAYLTKQILAGSGNVYDTFEELKSSSDNECALIADTYHRSVKYIQCLAAGIPISSHLWIINSCKANKLLDRDSYILPAGFSVITHSLSSDKNTLKKSAILFRGMKFYFGSRMSANLEQLWSPVLLAAQATIVKQDENMHNVITRKMVDIIIGDATCATELCARAKQLKIPVVSSEYIVQCLINGRKLPFDSAKCFHPDAF